jgi:hypothetical protein
LQIKTLISPISLGANASPIQLKIDFCKRSIDTQSASITPLSGSIPIVQIHFLVGQAGKPVKAKGRAILPTPQEIISAKMGCSPLSRHLDKLLEAPGGRGRKKNG